MTDTLNECRGSPESGGGKLTPEKPTRPLSSVAQIAQAALTFCALVLAVLGFFYTVKPVYTKMHAEEVAQSLRFHNQRFAIEQYIQRVLSASADLYKTYDVFVAELQTRHSGGSISCIDGPSGAAGDYARRNIPVPNICNRDALNPDVTGRQLIEDTLIAPNTELNILDGEQRDAIKKFISDFATSQKGLDAVLNFQFTAVNVNRPRPVDFLDLTIDEKNVVWAAVNGERERQEAAHIAFIAAVERMRIELLNAVSGPAS